MGYGTKALELLDAFYSGKLLNLDEAAKELKGESYLQASKVAEVSEALCNCVVSPRNMSQLTEHAWVLFNSAHRAPTFTPTPSRFEILPKCHRFSTACLSCSRSN